MQTPNDWYLCYIISARRFADHYCAYAQAHRTDFVALAEELDNLYCALDIYSHFQKWPSIIRLVQALDIFLDTQGYWTELRFWLEQIVSHDEVINDPTIRLEIFLTLAGITSFQGDRVKAEELYQEVIRLAEQINDKNHLKSAYYGLFTVYINQGRMDKARESLEQALTLAQQTGDQILEDLAHYSLKATGLITNAAEESLPILNFVTRIASTLQHWGEAFSASLRAWVYLTLNQYSRARQYYLDALEHLRQEGDAQGTAFVLYQLGLIAALEGDLGTALDYYRQSVSIARRMDDHTGLLLLYSSIGMIYLQQQRFDLARPYLERSVALAREAGNQREVAENLYWLGYAVANTGDPERAEQLFEESLAIFTQLGSPEAQKVRDALSRLRQVTS